MIWLGGVVIALVFAPFWFAAWRRERAVRRYEEYLASGTESKP